MALNRRTFTVSVVTLGLVGLSGVGVAWAATDGNSPSATASSNSSHRAGMFGMAYGKYSPMTAAANYLGLSQTELIKQMHAGKTLADIAKAQGKTVSGVQAAMVAAMQRNLAADKALTAAQRTAILALMKSHLAAMVSGEHVSGMDLDDMSGKMMGNSGTRMGGSSTGMMGSSSTGMMGR